MSAIGTNGNGTTNGRQTWQRIFNASSLAAIVAVGSFVYTWHKDSAFEREQLLGRILLLEQANILQDRILQDRVELGRAQREATLDKVIQLKQDMEILRIDIRHLQELLAQHLAQQRH